jgi:hypothetical protein
LFFPGEFLADGSELVGGDAGIVLENVFLNFGREFGEVSDLETK